MEVPTATKLKEQNLDEVLQIRDGSGQLDHSQVVAAIVGGSEIGVCTDCRPISIGKAATLATWAEIGTLSMGEAAARLAEFNQVVCGHLGEIALAEASVLELVAV